MVLRIAWELKVSEADVLAMDLDEFARWVAFFDIQRDEMKKASGK